MPQSPTPQIDLGASRPPAAKPGRISRVVMAGPRWLWSRTREAGGLDDIRQTTRMAYLAFVGGWLIFAWWLWQALTTPWSAGRMILGLEFIPFCAVFFLTAFKNAWQNWQLRTGRLGSAMDYLTTTEPFWPS